MFVDPTRAVLVMPATRRLWFFAKDFPTVVCLCGSTRFCEAFQDANLQETLAGRIVLSVGSYLRSDESLGLDAETKARLDQLHLRKIELADEVLILNVGGYIGESTARELAHARKLGRVVRFLEPDKAPKEIS